MVHPNSSTDPLNVQVLCAYAHFYKEHIYIYYRGMSSSFKGLLNLPQLVVKGQWLFSDVDVCNLSPCTVCIVQVLQKIIPRNPPDNFLPDTEYTCTLYNLAGTLTATQTIIYEGTYVGPFPRMHCQPTGLLCTKGYQYCTSLLCLCWGTFYQFCLAVINSNLLSSL